jgi:hypothetical protein
MRDAAKASEAETKRRVWQAAAQSGAALPEGFPPPPDPADVHRMDPPKPRLDALKASTSTGKSHHVRVAAGEMLQEPPAIPGIGRRILALAPSNKLAAEYKDRADAILRPLGKRASHYRGWSAENPERPCEAMCPMHKLRAELNAAGLDSAYACKRTIKKPNGEKETVWCSRNPDNPDRTEPPCGYLTQDLTGEFVVAAGGGTLTRPLPAALKRKLTLKLTPKEDGTSGGTKPVEIPAFDVVVMDENDKGQLFSTIDDGDDTGDEEEALPRRGALALAEMPAAVWPGMDETPLEEWRRNASEGDLLEQERCERLLRGVVAAAAGREGMLSPRGMRAVGSDEDWDAAHRWIWHCKPQSDLDIRPNTPPKEARRALAEQRRRFSLTRNVALLTRLVAIMVRKHPETEASTLVQNRGGRLVMQHPKELAPWTEGITTILCDANDGTPGLGWWWPDRRLRADIVAEHAPAGVRCIVAYDTSASRASLTPSKGKAKNAARDRRAAAHAENRAALVDVLAHLFDGNALFTGPKWQVEQVRKQHAARVAGFGLAYGHERHFMWQGIERGLNDAENVWCALHDGRPLPPSEALENEASLLRDGLPVPEEERGCIKVPSFHRMRDGTARAGERYGHRGPDVDRLVVQASVEPHMQMVERSRPRRRTPERPVLQICRSNLPLGDERVVDEMVPTAAIDRIHPEAHAAALGFVVRRRAPGCGEVLAAVLGAATTSIDPDKEDAAIAAAAEAMGNRLRPFDGGGLLDTVEKARRASPERLLELVAEGSPQRLVPTVTIGDGWLDGTRRVVAARAALGLWHPCRVRAPEAAQWTPIAVAGSNRAEAAARIAAGLPGWAVAWGDEAGGPGWGSDVEAMVLEAGFVVGGRVAFHAYQGRFRNEDAGKRAMAPLFAAIEAAAGAGGVRGTRSVVCFTGVSRACCRIGHHIGASSA